MDTGRGVAADTRMEVEEEEGTEEKGEEGGGEEEEDAVEEEVRFSAFMDNFHHHHHHHYYYHDQISTRCIIVVPVQWRCLLYRLEWLVVEAGHSSFTLIFCQAHDGSPPP